MKNNVTKADLVEKISFNASIKRNEVLTIVEEFMLTVKSSLGKGENIYLRGFGSFVIKKRAPKKARDIIRKTFVNIPAYNIPYFKPSIKFKESIKVKMPVKK